MLSQSPFGLAHLHWESWAIPTAGLACAGVALAIARIIAGTCKGTLHRPPNTSLQQTPIEPSPCRERRAGIRRGDRPTKILVSDADAVAEPFLGLVWNCSMGGLRLAVPRALEANTILSVRVADADSDRPWMQVEVKWCRARKDGWELGCQFVRTPPYCELLLFG
jgi:PilZ domain